MKLAQRGASRGGAYSRGARGNAHRRPKPTADAPRRRRLASLVCALGVAVAALPASAGAQDGAEAAAASVDRFHNTLVEVMQAGAFAVRLKLLEPAVAEFFDAASIARISVGASWRGLAEEQRTAFIALLGRLIVATYADRFDGYSGQRFQRVDAVAASTGVVIRSQLIRSNGQPVNLDYYFRGDKVFNVVADGVSDLSLRRADYAGIIRKQGFAALVLYIESSIAEAGAGPSD